MDFDFQRVGVGHGCRRRKTAADGAEAVAAFLLEGRPEVAGVRDGKVGHDAIARHAPTSTSSTSAGSAMTSPSCAYVLAGLM
ncbi:hypothetical protein G6F35_017834 [Rhizopus arrhizus]|nr:hypothetical protein G6F35_017834 [Rhizopus arrhizus]KAG1228600.1 hypothetical protein G6F68_019467 [Rhizopus microsporus]